MCLSKRSRTIKASPTMAADQEAKEILAEFMDGINGTAGQPHLFAPEQIKQAIVTAVEKDMTRYTASKGTLGLRKAIAEKFSQDNGLSYDPETEIVVGNGGKSVLSAAIGSCIDEGDEVIVIKPFWTSYPVMVQLWGGKPVFFDIREGVEKIEKLLNEYKNIKVIILNSPANPTGQVLTAYELQVLAEVLKNKDIMVITDEIYEKIVFDHYEHLSIAQFLPVDKVIVVNGHSKAYSMTGLRIGYAAGPEAHISLMATILSQLAGCPCSTSQEAAIVALTDPKVAEFVKRMKKIYEHNAIDLIIPFAEKMKKEYPGFDYFEPQGAFYLFFKLPDKFVGKCDLFRSELLHQKHLATVHGLAFGYPGWIRLSFAMDPETLKEALKRIEEFFKES